MTHIPVNPFRTRLPFFYTDDWANQPFLQKNRGVCSPDAYQPPIQPMDFCPEFIVAIPWSNSITINSCTIHDVINDETEQTITSLVSSLSATGQVIIPQVGERAFVAFTGFPAFEGFFSEIPCGRYQIRLTVNNNKYYSEIFEVRSFFVATANYGEEYLTLSCRTDCFFHGIPWNEMAIGHYMYAYLDAKMVRMVPELEEEVETAPDGTETVISSSLSHKYQGTVLEVGHPLHQQLSMMQLYRPDQSGDGVTFTLQRRSTSDGLGNYSVRQLVLGQANYSASKCCPSMQIDLVLREKSMGDGCCDDQYTPCLSDFTPPAPELTLSGGDDITVEWETSTSYPPEDGTIPQNCWVDVYYRAVGNPSWSILQNQNASTGGVQIVNFTTGVTYEFALKCQNWNDSDCDSQLGTVATIAVP